MIRIDTQGFVSHRKRVKTYYFVPILEYWSCVLENVLDSLESTEVQ